MTLNVSSLNIKQIAKAPLSWACKPVAMYKVFANKIKAKWIKNAQ
jgi:hypothetical protein